MGQLRHQLRRPPRVFDRLRVVVRAPALRLQQPCRRIVRVDGNLLHDIVPFQRSDEFDHLRLCRAPVQIDQRIVFRHPGRPAVITQRGGVLFEQRLGNALQEIVLP